MTGGNRREEPLGEQLSIATLQQELAATQRGLLALTLELEERVDERTVELRVAHAELARTNSELLQLTTGLEARVAARTAELDAKNNEIQAMTQQLWQSAKLATMGELSASVAHELNNPLATISLRVESLLAQIAPDDPKHRPLEIIQGENERMGGLVRRLLESSRRSVQQISTLDVGQEVDSTLELALHYLRNRNVSVQREFTENVPLIHADRQQLRQLFLNLVTNASDAMPNGGTLTIRIASLESEEEESLAPVGVPPDTAPVERPSRRVVVEVSDTGVGIPEELLARVGEAFFTTKPEGQGTGLGLAICRRIAEEHGGHLDISSTVGRGTTVRVAFPAGPA